MARIPGAANACPIRATARRSKACWPRSTRAELDGDREALRRAMPPGAARNALDCALWDLEAKTSGKPAWKLAGLAAAEAGRHLLHAEPRHAGDRWRRRRAQAADMPLLKVKLGGDGDAGAHPRRAARGARCRARRRRQRGVERGELRREHAGLRARRDVALIEQPLPAGRRRSSARASRTSCRSAPTRACTSPPTSTRSPANTTASTSSSTRPAG